MRCRSLGPQLSKGLPHWFNCLLHFSFFFFQFTSFWPSALPCCLAYYSIRFDEDLHMVHLHDAIGARMNSDTASNY